MSTHMRAFLASGLGELRYEPTGKRIRAVLGDQTAVDSTRAALVWEPRRIVPSYAVPADDVLGELSPAGAAVAGRPGEAGVVMPGLSRRPVLDPSVPGQASYWSVTLCDQVIPDIAWAYQQPLHDASRVRGLTAFFDERVDVTVDGQRHEPPITPWS